MRFCLALLSIFHDVKPNIFLLLAPAARLLSLRHAEWNADNANKGRPAARNRPARSFPMRKFSIHGVTGKYVPYDTIKRTFASAFAAGNGNGAIRDLLPCAIRFARKT